MIISSYKSFHTKMLSVLEAIGCKDILFATSISQAQKLIMTENISAIIMNAPLKDELGLDFAVKYSDLHGYPIFISVTDNYFEQVSEKTAKHNIFVLSEKADTNTLVQSLLVYIQAAKKLKKLQRTNTDKEEGERELALISRAKMLLISALGMSEEQAHKYIERRSMESRKTKKAIAESIINSYGS